MNRFAANPAAQPNSPLRALRMPFLSIERLNGACERPSFSGSCAAAEKLLLGRTSAAETRWGDCGPVGASASYPVLCSGSRSGPFRRPAALGLLLRVPRPCGVSVPPGTSLRTAGPERRANFFRAPPRKQTFGTWEPGPLAWLRRV
jgi:hypothetical protein